MSDCRRAGDAVGHAFSALEPDEDRALLEHLPTCRACRRALHEALTVVAALGAAVPPTDPPARLRRRVLEAVHAEPAPPVPPVPTRSVSPEPPPVPVPAPPRPSDAGRRRSWRSVAALAVAAVTLGIGLIIARAALPTETGPTGDPATTTLADRADQVVGDAEARDPQTRHATLRDRTGSPVAVVLEDAGGPRMVALDLPAASPSQDYVLWGTPYESGAAPVAVATMDPDDGVTRPLDGATAPASPRGYAVSVEPTGAVPERPSTVVAVGALL